MDTPVEAVSHLLVYLLDAEALPLTAQAAYIRERMTEVGFDEAEAVRAWTDAKAAGYTQTDRLGRDQLTDAGRVRGEEMRARMKGVS